MKKRVLCIGLVLALVLAVFTPSIVLAADPVPFTATASVSAITPGTVAPMGNTGWWVVAKRQMSGELSGDISGSYTFTYRAIIESIYTQAGTFHGNLVTDTNQMRLWGNSDPLTFLGVLTIPAPPYAVPVFRLDIAGDWAFTDGTHGSGAFSGSVVFVPTPEGHIGNILPGFINADGLHLTGVALDGTWLQ